MKRFVLMLLVVGAMAQPLRVAGIHVLYRVHRPNVIRDLCEQRHVPGSGCEGEGSFQNRLKYNPQRGQQLPVSLRLSVLDLLPMPEAFRLTSLALPHGWQEAQMPSKLLVYPPCPIAAIFHPPRFKAHTFFSGSQEVRIYS